MQPLPTAEARGAHNHRMFGISLSDYCFTIVSGSATCDSRLALHDQFIERCMKIDFVEKPVANHFAVSVGQARASEIEAEPKWTFKDANQHWIPAQTAIAMKT